METVFLVGIGVFAVSSLYFLGTQKKPFNTSFIVSFVTIASYVIMYEGSFASVSTATVPIFWTRWVFYAISCTLLTFEMSRVLGIEQKKAVFLLYLTAIVMLTGALSSYYTGTFMIVFYVISTVAYILLLAGFLKSSSEHRGVISKYLYFGWTGFAVVFLFSPEGFGLVDNAIAAAIFLLLDIFTKIVFYIDLKNKAPAT
ncbi:MAG: bacteriorhodopsin [Spirochaetales bacterium]